MNFRKILAGLFTAQVAGDALKLQSNIATLINTGSIMSSSNTGGILLNTNNYAVIRQDMHAKGMVQDTTIAIPQINGHAPCVVVAGKFTGKPTVVYSQENCYNVKITDTGVDITADPNGHTINEDFSNKNTVETITTNKNTDMDDIHLCEIGVNKETGRVEDATGCYSLVTKPNGNRYVKKGECGAEVNGGSLEVVDHNGRCAIVKDVSDGKITFTDNYSIPPRDSKTNTDTNQTPYLGFTKYNGFKPQIGYISNGWYNAHTQPDQFQDYSIPYACPPNTGNELVLSPWNLQDCAVTVNTNNLPNLNGTTLITPSSNSAYVTFNGHGCSDARGQTTVALASEVTEDKTEGMLAVRKLKRGSSFDRNSAILENSLGKIFRERLEKNRATKPAQLALPA